MRVKRFLLSILTLLMPVTVWAAAPTASDQSVNVAPGGYVWFFLSITDPDTSVYSVGMTVTILSGPAHGTVQSYAQVYNYSGYNNYIRYTPTDSGFSGTDSFSWYCSDGTGTSGVATVSITISNTVPIAYSSTNSAGSGAQASIYLNKTDPDGGQVFTYDIVTPPAHGGGYVSGNYYYYTSFPGYLGPDSFTWRVWDSASGTSGVATAVVNVTATPPVPITGQKVIVGMNTPTIIQPLFTGGGGYSCSLVRVTGYLKGPLHGTAVATNGNQFLYTPDTDFAGPDLIGPADGSNQGMDYFYYRIAYSNATTPLTYSIDVAFAVNIVTDPCTNADWTQWRHDEYRSGQTPMALPDSLYLQWRRDVPTAPNPYPTYPTAEYCRPVQLGKTLFVSRVANDSVTAYDTETGDQKWRYYAGGALRRPPVAVALTNGTNVVIFGCDDGHVYCLNAADGSELWKFRGAPSAKKAMGFGRLSSVWPVWASPTVYKGKVYFVAGFFPTQCLYGYCLDAATGAVVWRNDGRMMGEGFHSALGTPTISFDHKWLYGTSGMHKRWAVDLLTGELEPIWNGFTAANATQEDGKRNSSAFKFMVDGNGLGITEPTSIVAGGRTYTTTDAAALGAVGTIVNMLAGDGKLFVVTAQGSIYCFGGSTGTPTIHTLQTTPLSPVTDSWTTAVGSMLSRADLKQGLALVWGVGSGRLVEELAVQAPGLMIVAADPDPAKLRTIREKMDAAGWSGARVSTLPGNPMDCGFAPYQAALIASEDVSVAGVANGPAMVKMLYGSTRPFGGEIWLPTTDGQHTSIAGWFTSAALPLFEVARSGGFTQLKRTGLPDEKLVMKPPFRLIAYGDMNSSLNRSASGLQRGVKGGKDIYSWLPVTAAMTGYEPAPPSANNIRAYSGWYGGPVMTNSLYGRKESTAGFSGFIVGSVTHCSIPCLDQYGDLYMMTAKTPMLMNEPQDLSQYWGIIKFEDRGGCGGGGTFAGNGIFTYSGPNSSCLCNAGMYGVQGQFASVPEEDNNENWIIYRTTRSNSRIQEEPIRRVGVNFGAVGDRFFQDEQMLWTHHPAAARWLEGPVLLPVSYRGDNARRVYHHSAQMEPATTRPAVSASQVTGMDGITVPLAMPLVAPRSATVPVLDGNLNDPCWAGPATEISPVSMWFKKYGEVNPNSFVRIRYDDANLYVAAAMPAELVYTRYWEQSGWTFPPDRYVTLTLNSRGRVGADVTLTCSQTGRSSTGISTSQWQSAWSTNAAPFSAEAVIPWSALEAAGLWKEQLIMNVDICGGRLVGAGCFSPLYLDAARGSANVAKPHTVRLYFAEMEDQAAGQRVFDVKLQGQTVLENLDVAAAAGGPRRELVRECTNVLISTGLDIDFVKKAGEPMLSGVEIVGTYEDSPNVKPTAFIDASTASGPAPLEVTLSAYRSYDHDGQIVECVWETGDGRLARDPVVRHVFAEPGTYKVNLLVLDNRGRTATASTTVTVTAGAPASFVCTIRASGGDYTNLTTWSDAIASDLTGSTLVFPVAAVDASASTYAGAQVTFSGGGVGTLSSVTSNSVSVAQVSGTVNTGAVTVLYYRTYGSPRTIFTTTGPGVAMGQPLLFTVGSRGTYATSDDGIAVTFTGGGTGMLKHLNGLNIAYVIACQGTIQPGLVTCASGHTFTVADAGSPIYTAVAECYHDWPRGLNDSVTMTGWITDENRCATIRPAPGHGHNGRLKLANGDYTGFAIYGFYGLSAPAYTRMERIIGQSAAGYYSFSLGNGSSANRILCTVAPLGVSGRGVIANSISDIISYGGDGLVLNCTAKTLSASQYSGWSWPTARAVNCLVTGGGAGFNGVPDTCLRWINHCVSVDGTATQADSWKIGNEGNRANQAVSFVNAAGGDYHLADADSGARWMGVTALGTDIDGQDRPGLHYDVGADQNLAAYQIPAAWKLQWFGSTNGVGTGDDEDWDHDGMSNMKEFLAGTCPTNRASLLAFGNLVPDAAGANLILSWQSVAGKLYAIETATNLVTGFNEMAVEHILPTPTVNTQKVPMDPAGTRFYRVVIEP